MDAAAFRATFHNFKCVLGRGVVQWVFETPLEDLENVLNVVGTPKPGEEPWFGIARLNGAPGVSSEG